MSIPETHRVEGYYKLKCIKQTKKQAFATQNVHNIFLFSMEAYSSR